MLLADLLKHTPPTHKDFANLEKATSLVGDVASTVNSKAAEAERIAKVIEIQNRLIDCTMVRLHDVPSCFLYGLFVHRENALTSVGRSVG
jgi:hypothetical protein